MQSEIVVAVISGIITLIGIVLSAKATSDKVTNEITRSNAVQSAEIVHIKEEIVEMKKDIKEHNNYGKRFLEMQGELKVLDNRQAVSEHRIDDLERKVN